MVEARCKDVGMRNQDSDPGWPPGRSLAGTPWPGYYWFQSPFPHLKNVDGKRPLYGSNKLACPTAVEPLCSGLLRPWRMVLGQKMEPLKVLLFFRCRQVRSAIMDTQGKPFRRENAINNDEETENFKRERRYWKFVSKAHELWIL